MRDAFGGIVNIAIIVVFMTIVSGYLAFNVSYTKAFKVKNYIISVYEEYDGCDEGSFRTVCNEKITNYLREIGYSAPDPTNFDSANVVNKEVELNNYVKADQNCGNGYCVIELHDTDTGSSNAEAVLNKSYRSFRVVTVVYLDIPIINNIMSGMNMFQITGDTKKMVYDPD